MNTAPNDDSGFVIAIYRRLDLKIMKFFPGITIAAVLWAAILAAGCGGSPESRPSGDAAAAATTPVEVAKVQRQTLSVNKQFSGTLEGEEQANVVAKISERVTAINARVGEEVRAGQVLVELDKSGATSQYYQAQAGFSNAQKTYERMKALYQEGAISLQTLDGAQTAYEVAKANFEAATSAVELTTPIPGVVTAVNVSIGDLSVPGGVLITVAKINRMKVDFDVNELDLGSLSVGHRVQVYSEARPDVRADGEIIQLSKSADVRSRTFQMKAGFENTPDRWFRPGMFCRVNVPLSSGAGSLVIPASAVVSDGITNRVFLVRDGRSIQRNIEVGMNDGKNVEVLSGLSEGDMVVTTGATSARDSGFVSISNR